LSERERQHDRDQKIVVLLFFEHQRYSGNQFLISTRAKRERERERERERSYEEYTRTSEDKPYRTQLATSQHTDSKSSTNRYCPSSGDACKSTHAILKPYPTSSDSERERE
jgi:hypothetical protein